MGWVTPCYIFWVWLQTKCIFCNLASPQKKTVRSLWGHTAEDHFDHWTHRIPTGEGLALHNIHVMSIHTKRMVRCFACILEKSYPGWNKLFNLCFFLDYEVVKNLFLSMFPPSKPESNAHSFWLQLWDVKQFCTRPHTIISMQHTVLISNLMLSDLRHLSQFFNLPQISWGQRSQSQRIGRPMMDASA